MIIVVLSMAGKKEGFNVIQINGTNVVMQRLTEISICRLDFVTRSLTFYLARRKTSEAEFSYKCTDGESKVFCQPLSQNSFSISCLLSVNAKRRSLCPALSLVVELIAQNWNNMFPPNAASRNRCCIYFVSLHFSPQVCRGKFSCNFCNHLR